MAFGKSSGQAGCGSALNAGLTAYRAGMTNSIFAMDAAASELCVPVRPRWYGVGPIVHALGLA